MSDPPPPAADPDDTSPDSEIAAERAGLGGLIRSHPWITLIMAACTVGGAVFGPLFFDETWSLARQISAGAFLGAWIGLTITVTKMIG